MQFRRRSPLYLFLLWSESRPQESRILADLSSQFTIRDLIDVHWTTDETFARNLTRMYGDALPPGSEKELHCGTGPFLAVVVEDHRPRYRVRRTSRGLTVLNSSIFDARLRYRRWTGGGYRVHASDSALETQRNLVLLFGKGTAEFRAGRPPVAGPRRYDADPIGTTGWDSIGQLLLALKTYGAQLITLSETEDKLTVIAIDVWWVERIAGGCELSPGVREVQVAGRSLELTFCEQARQRARFSRMIERRLSGGFLG